MPKTKLTGLALWGAIIGLIGGLLGFFSFLEFHYDRFVPPGVEILGIRPVAIFSKKQMLATNDYYPAYGISAIVHVRAKNRRAIVGGLELSGKIYMSVNEYSAYSNSNEGKPTDDIAKEVGYRKPFYLISFSAWPTNPNVAIQLEPFEERYIAFTFLEPTLLTDGKEIKSEFLGIERESILPKWKRTHADPFDVFEYKVAKDQKSLQPFKTRDEIKNGLARFYLRVGPKTLAIQPAKLKDFVVIRQEEWKEQSPSKLFNQPSRF